MARINIDDEWFDDPRRADLTERIGGVMADGVALRMWRLAQTYYRVQKLVPVDLFEKIPHAKEFEEAGLAERKIDGVYIKGQRDRFAWLALRSEAGTKGGKKPKKSHDAPSKQTKANESKRKQVEASSSSSPSFSSSSSVSDSVSKGSDGVNPPVTQVRTLNQRIWDAYQEEYKARYDVEPERNATVNSQIKQIGERLGDKAPDVARFYVRHNKAYYVERHHAIGLLLSDAESLSTQWKLNAPMLSSQAREVERMQHNSSSFDRAAEILERRKAGHG